MSEELIERLRESTVEFARNTRVSGVVTCERALRDPPKSGWCCEVRDGHQCRWSGPSDSEGVRHRNYPHTCRCGFTWERQG